MAVPFNQPSIFIVDGQDSLNRLVLRGCAPISAIDGTPGITIFGNAYQHPRLRRQITVTGGSSLWPNQTYAPAPVRTDPQALANTYKERLAALQSVPDEVQIAPHATAVMCTKRVLPRHVYFEGEAPQGASNELTVSTGAELQGAVVATTPSDTLTVLAQPQ